MAFFARFLLRAAAAAIALPLAAQAAPGKAYGRSSERVEVCSWDRPGHNRYTGSVAAALDRYTDIPAEVRHRLRQRMEAHEYDDIASIGRDSIEGRHGYRPDIRDMHFGRNRICQRVTRDGWTPEMQERGLVYCESEHCILVPTVCGNVSRIERRPEAVMPARAFGDGDPAPPLPPVPMPGDSLERLVGFALPSSLGPRRAGPSSPPVPFGPSPSGGSAPPFGGTPDRPTGPGGTPFEPFFPPPVFPPPGGPPPGGPPPGGPPPGGPPPGMPPPELPPPELPPPELPPPELPPPELPPPELPPPSTWTVPEPGTGLLVLAGLGLLARRPQRRAGVPRCATQKRS